jgi:putative ABC transport system ATP-binding protein
MSATGYAGTTTIAPERVAAQVTSATKVYGDAATGVRALDEVTMGMPAGRWTAIMGPSGSGKSTLLHCMAGLDSLTSGQATIGDQDLAGLSDEKLAALRRRRIGFVFQGFNLVPTLTALENVTLPFLLDGARPDPAWVDELLSTLGLADRTTHRPGQLSGGQQQRVAVARALVTRPDIVFADEPTGNLDSRSSGEVLGILRHAVDRLGQTVAMVTHDPNAAAAADAVVFLADGRVVDEMADPTAQAVLDRMKELS